MKVLLINPSVTIFPGGTNPRVFMPLGLLSIAAQLEKNGHEVIVFDSLLKAIFFHHDGDKYFGTPWDDIVTYVQKINPDIVGIPVMFSSQSPNSKKLAKLVKNINKDILTIVGGAHASACYQDMLADPDINFVVVGEGELVFCELLDALENKKDLTLIQGLVTRYRDVLVNNFTPKAIINLDDLPLPAYHLYDLKRYFYLQNNGYCARPISYGKREISIVTSRGCPHNCIFCSIHPVMGKKWRAHSPGYVVRHIQHLQSKYDVDLVHFEDDNFSLDRNRFSEILDLLAIQEKKIMWDPPNGLRADSLDLPILEKAKRTGCQYVVIAIESGVQRVLDEVIDKKMKLQKIIDVAKICQKINIELYAYYVIGLPGETWREVKQTLDFALKMLIKYFVYPQIATASPVFGSRLYQVCKNGGYLDREVTPQSLGVAYDVTGLSLIKTSEFTPYKLKHILKQYNMVYFGLVFVNILRQPGRLWNYFKILGRNRYLLRKLVFAKRQ